jgi:hypothetical protein
LAEPDAKPTLDPVSGGIGLGLVWVEERMLEVIVPSGVTGRKLALLVLSATDVTLSAATDDSVGVIDDVLVLRALVEPDDALFIYA